MKKHLVALVAVVAVLVGSLPVMAAEKTLNLYIWSEYMPDEVLADFTKETGIKVKISTYDSNETLYAKIKMLGGKGYDLIVPSAEYVSRMAGEGLLATIDKNRLPNLANLDENFRNLPYDPDGAHSVPYMWGTTGIAVNTAMVPAGQVTGYADLWNPALAGKLLLPDDMRTTFGMALKVLGYSTNDTDPAHIEQAFLRAKSLYPAVKVFDSDSPKQALLNGEVAVAVLWNGEAYVTNAENDAIVYVYPKEGANRWVDNLCIPKNAANVENAHAFINYLLDPKVAARISQEMGYATPNKAAMALLPAEVRDNQIIYPPADKLKGSEFETDLGQAQRLYDQYWTKLKTGR
ncbi:polyamine ABC transporter substrate-binding protein [Desulfolutivibrio sulfoxidireducens]|uniref:polyamine ABC transporter substrate-binding protein n=1 Tax=Desulfolutivibrio sulfoxidireducens TaxID=2773299 RepID=UPI00159D20A2|nr:spermidine/putrescine ABC transporter substrate-binding protein [Desulfolutivibrio sulfoxidireducens]QLA16388.1 extracellular solute-binding protein [Desulfolutivibrio sulfoxidireducens]QLA19731.1 extracellular solute-binding protein [Desulfolutivibrio sulfoxidireducens]